MDPAVRRRGGGCGGGAAGRGRWRRLGRWRCRRDAAPRCCRVLARVPVWGRRRRGESPVNARSAFPSRPTHDWNCWSASGRRARISRPCSLRTGAMSAPGERESSHHREHHQSAPSPRGIRRRASWSTPEEIARPNRMPRKTVNRTVLDFPDADRDGEDPMASAAARMMSRERHPEDCGGSGARRSCGSVLSWLALSWLAAFDRPGSARPPGWSVMRPAGVGMARQRLLARPVGDRSRTARMQGRDRPRQSECAAQLARRLAGCVWLHPPGVHKERRQRHDATASS